MVVGVVVVGGVGGGSGNVCIGYGVFFMGF